MIKNSLSYTKGDFFLVHFTALLVTGTNILKVLLLRRNNNYSFYSLIIFTFIYQIIILFIKIRSKSFHKMKIFQVKQINSVEATRSDLRIASQRTHLSASTLMFSHQEILSKHFTLDSQQHTMS